MAKGKRLTVLELLFSIYIGLILTTVGIVIVLFITNGIKESNGLFVDFNENWVTESGETVAVEDFDKDTKVTKVLPNITEDTTLFFRAKNVNMRVYKDGVLFKDYESEMQGNLVGYKTPGTYFLRVPIYREDSNKSITIEILCPYKGNIKSMYLGDYKDILYKEISEKLPGFAVCLLLIFLGIIFIVVSFPLKQYDGAISGLLNLGLFSLVFGVWSLTETKLLQLIWGNSSIIHLATSMTLVLIVPPLFLFYRNRHKQTSKFSVYLICIGVAISFFVEILLHFFDIADMHETIWLTHITQVLGVVFTLYFALKGSKKDPTVYGLFGVGLLCGVDVVLYYLQITADNSMFARIGALIYIVFLGIQIMGNYLEVYQQAKQAELLQRLAYEDLLTNMYNRNSFMDDLKIINTNLTDNVGRVIMVFDVNCLKYINDTFGHNMGDAVLKEGAELIKKTFDEIGKCYRIGGDEFAVISDTCDLHTDVLDSLYSEYTEYTEIRNKNTTEEKPYPLYIAFGYAVIDADATTAKDVFDIADQRMYANKIELKKKINIETGIETR